MGKDLKTTPVAEAAAGVTTETAGTAQTFVSTLEAQVAQLKKLLDIEKERADAAEAKVASVTQDLSGKLLELNNDFDTQLKRAETAEALAETLEQELETHKAKTLVDDTEKLFYEAADGNTYELVQPEFRYRGTLYQGEEVITNHDLLEELIGAKAFVLKKVE